MANKTNSQCLHESVLDNNGEGSAVCLKCGQILDPIYLFSSQYVRDQTESDKFLENKHDLKHREDDIELITTLCDLWHFPKQVINDTIELYVFLLKRNENNKCMYKRKIFAFAFYKTLLSHHCSRSIDEICLLFNIVNVKTFSQFAMEQNIELHYNLDDFFQRFTTNLEFTFEEKKIIKSYLNKLQNVPNLQPKTLCSLAILHFHYTKKSSHSTQHIANQCGLTYQTMMKNYKYCKHLLL